MGISIVVPDANFSEFVAFDFPMSDSLLGYWLMGEDAVTSRENLKTGALGSFIGGPTFTTNKVTLGPTKYFDTGITMADDYTMMAVGTLPSSAGQTAILCGNYQTSGGSGFEALVSAETVVTHTLNGSTRGTINRIQASDGTLSGIRMAFASYNFSFALLTIYDEERPINVSFPETAANPAGSTFKAGGRTTSLLNFDLQALMLWDRALSSDEKQAVFDWLVPILAARGVTVA